MIFDQKVGINMETVYSSVHALFAKSPEIAIFLSLAIGFWIGKFKFGSFQLGGVAGSLLVAVVVSQFGVTVSDTVKNILFALFIFAVGYDSGPQFFRSLGKQTLREIALAVIVALSGLATVVVMAKMFGLDKGLAAGIAAGGLTQSAIMGVAGDALGKMGLDAETVKTLVGNIGVGYAVTYVFGSFGAIIVCVNILPKFMGKSLREAAIEAEAEMNGGSMSLGSGEEMALSALVGRIFKVKTGSFSTIKELEESVDSFAVTVEKVKRGDSFLGVSQDLSLKADDYILIVGRREAISKISARIGEEVDNISGMEMVMKKQQVSVTNPRFIGKTISEIRAQAKSDVRHGVYVMELSRAGTNVKIEAETVIHEGDMITVYGSQEDVKRVTEVVGFAIVPSDKTDFVFMGLGLVAGLLIGMIVVKLGSLPITLGSGGGALLSGLVFGWYRSKHPQMGNLPSSAAQLLKDLGLAGFVVIVGLNSGLQALTTIEQHGITIFMVGVVVTILPLLIAMVLGRYLLGYKNAAIFAGALSGARSANPAFGEILNNAGNSVPTNPFAITYALANVFLTLLGPFIVALV